MKICPVGAELVRADGRTDRHDEAMVAFRNFAKAPKN
jgi:predicted NAD/FAD-binding protein